MKKEWKKPELEMLDVNMTMFNTTPSYRYDHTFTANQGPTGYDFS